MRGPEQAAPLAQAATGHAAIDGQVPAEDGVEWGKKVNGQSQGARNHPSMAGCGEQEIRQGPQQRLRWGHRPGGPVQVALVASLCIEGGLAAVLVLGALGRALPAGTWVFQAQQYATDRQAGKQAGRHSTAKKNASHPATLSAVLTT